MSGTRRAKNNSHRFTRKNKTYVLNLQKISISNGNQRSTWRSTTTNSQRRIWIKRNPFQIHLPYGRKWGVVDQKAGQQTIGQWNVVHRQRRTKWCRSSGMRVLFHQTEATDHSSRCTMRQKVSKKYGQTDRVQKRLNSSRKLSFRQSWRNGNKCDRF